MPSDVTLGKVKVGVTVGSLFLRSLPGFSLNNGTLFAQFTRLQLE
jgi:hypothetical protein